MGNRSLPYESFGHFILFKRLEEGSLSELWRAGLIDGNALGPTMALRRFRGGDRQGLRQAASVARGVVRQIEGTSVVRDQEIEVSDGLAWIAHEYSGGRSLRIVLDRATDPAAPHPIPVDQALAITERLIASSQYLQSIKLNGARLVHGALIPQLVWITEDGEVRVAGHQMARGIIASLKDPGVRKEIGHYMAPELHRGSEPSPATEIYAIGAMLFAMLMGQEPPDPMQEESFADSITGAVMMFDDEPVPADIRAILEKSLAIDPARRYGSLDEMHQAMAKLIGGGNYAPTTFNLAFYLHTLLKNEMQVEAGERKIEEKVDVAPYLVKPPEPEPRPERKTSPGIVAAAAISHPPAHAVSPLSSLEKPSRSKLPLIAAAIVLLAAVGGAAYWVLEVRPQEPAASAQPQSAPPPGRTAAPEPVEPPIFTAVAELEPADPALGTDTAATELAAEEQARRQAFEEEVNRRLQEEVARLQADYERQLVAERARMTPREAPRTQPAPAEPQRAASVPPPPTTTSATVAEPRLDADRLNQQRLDQIERSRDAAAAETPTATATTTTSAPVPEPAVVQTATQAPPPPVPAVREGDLIELAALDQQPRIVRQAQPDYPPIARKQRLEATLIISVLISETGEVADVKVLRGDPRNVGFEDSAIRAARGARFSSPMKDGKRVRTWLAFPVRFQLPR